MHILMVLTSHGQLGNTGRATGFWLEEFAAPYYVFKDAGAQITLASVAGGKPPIDPKSREPGAQTEATDRLDEDEQAQALLAATRQLSDVQAGDYDAVFYPGGHGPLWDLADNPASLALIEKLNAARKPVAAVCHAPGVLCAARAPDGSALVAGKRATGFSNSEEAAAQLIDVVPFLVEDSLKAAGAIYEKAANGQPMVLVDGNLVTGQNPASAEPAAKAVLKLLRER